METDELERVRPFVEIAANKEDSTDEKRQLNAKKVEGIDLILKARAVTA
jgi:hypothetical protein